MIADTRQRVLEQWHRRARAIGEPQIVWNRKFRPRCGNAIRIERAGNFQRIKRVAAAGSLDSDQQGTGQPVTESVLDNAIERREAERADAKPADVVVRTT